MLNDIRWLDNRFQEKLEGVPEETQRQHTLYLTSEPAESYKRRVTLLCRCGWHRQRVFDTLSLELTPVGPWLRDSVDEHAQEIVGPMKQARDAVTRFKEAFPKLAQGLFDPEWP